ncbi:hypothetical protein ACFFQW_43265 [Umezawaea endophytica]|uniref:Uncharacterized protein n=1 Tax=Umezawaea endophytica TaxID=1654476 RepID=A0A9X2VXN0_9PSEU|nr:hypothetical protein [Umezawaea endophytica]MCS7484746.1 hypothetical protein [Umezawaea endophytica]
MTQTRPEQPTSTGPHELLVDRFAPRSDFTLAHHRLVDADPDTAYRAVRELDLTEVHGTLVDTSMWLRSIPERVKYRKRGPVRTPTRLTLDDLAAGSERVVLGERPGEEIAFGAVGRFWQPVVEWRPVEPRDFVDFSEPGFGKIVCSLSVLPYGTRRSLVTYDVRTIFDDPPSWVGFRRYWRVVKPFVGVIQRAALRTIADTAERGGPR